MPGGIYTTLDSTKVESGFAAYNSYATILTFHHRQVCETIGEWSKHAQDIYFTDSLKNNCCCFSIVLRFGGVVCNTSVKLFSLVSQSTDLRVRSISEFSCHWVLHNPTSYNSQFPHHLFLKFPVYYFAVSLLSYPLHSNRVTQFTLTKFWKKWLVVSTIIVKTDTIRQKCLNYSLYLCISSTFYYLPTSFEINSRKLEFCLWPQSKEIIYELTEILYYIQSIFNTL